MNDPMRDGEEGGAPVTEAALRRLIAEGSRSGPVPRGSGDPPSDDSLRALAAVLGAAVPAVPSTGSGVLKGEEEALAAFRTARDERPADASSAAAGLRGRLARLTRRLGRTRTGALGVVAAAVLGSGVAVASGGVPFLPGGGPGGAPGASRAPDTDSAPPAPASPKAPTTGEAGPARPHHDGFGPGAVPPSEAPARIVALCRARQRDPGGEDGPDGAGLRSLAAAAGGRDRVDAYCAAVLEGPAARPSPADGGRGDGNGGGGNPGGNGATPDIPDRPDRATGETGETGGGQENANPQNPGSGNGDAGGNPGIGNAGGANGRGDTGRSGERPGSGPGSGGGSGGRDTGNPGNGSGGTGGPGRENGAGNGAGDTRAEAARDRGTPADRPAPDPPGNTVR
ncbi:hypothetical protein [Streptomyces mangrovi]|uniref:hypothetical protein n=1 Tax=Streptomyces mangrovi TaxID=1206892 RepID=UPI00399CB437